MNDMTSFSIFILRFSIKWDEIFSFFTLISSIISLLLSFIVSFLRNDEVLISNSSNGNGNKVDNNDNDSCKLKW